MPELAYINGCFCPIDQASVSIEDRGFQFGDGVYEVIFTYGGRPFQLDQHLGRLRRSLEAIELDFDFAKHPLEPVIEDGLARSGFADAMVYVQITRGAAPRSHCIPEHVSPTVAMTFKPRPLVPQQLRRDGIRLMTVADTRWANCYVKAITLLPNVLAKSQAVRKGFDDAVFVSDAGEVRECTSSNIFMVRDGKIIFPPRTEAVLHGVTQRFLLECARAIRVEVDERAINVDELHAAEEVFISSTAVEVLGVTSIDGRPIGTGGVGAITRRLFEEFQRRVAQTTAQVG